MAAETEWSRSSLAKGPGNDLLSKRPSTPSVDISAVGFYLLVLFFFVGPKIIRMRLCGEQRAYLDAYAYAFDTMGCSYFPERAVWV